MAAAEANPKIAILGWGSLIWDDGWPAFDKERHAWQADGPTLPLEFSRVSASRDGALTLVIDQQHGAPCRSMYALSRRANPDDAIADLRDREGTSMRLMGYYFRDKSRAGQVLVPETIPQWAEDAKIDVVVWAGMPSNFKEKSALKKGTAFSVDAAIAHLQGLTARGKAAAATYVWRAPDLVQTPLRTRLETEPWFADPDQTG